MSRLSSLHLTRIKKVHIPEEGLHPFEYAQELATQQFIPSAKIEEAVSIVLTTPTLTHVYINSRLLLQKIIYAGSDVVLWTQGDPQLQQAKCDTSGLLELNQDEHAKGTITVSAHANKIITLGNELTDKRVNGRAHLVFIDDKSSQLLAAYTELLKLKEVDKKRLPDSVSYIWMRRPSNTKTNHLLPTGFRSQEELNTFMGGSLSSIHDIEELAIRPDALYFIDLDRTLIDVDAWFLTVQKRIAYELSP